jgi:HD superfamily phosphohydrolase YqeK
MSPEDLSLQNIQTCRRINRKAAEQYEAHGVTAEDAAIAAIYSAHDLALHTGRDPHEAIEWMRTALDMMERQLLGESPRRAH